MKKNKKILILTSVLVVLIVFVALVMVFDFDLLLFKNLSIVGIENKKQDVEELKEQKDIETDKYESLLDSLKQAKDNFDVQKQAYENIPSSDIAIVQQATIDEKYFIEYLWVVLGNYAKANNLAINIITPGASYATSNNNTTESEINDNTKSKQATSNNANDDNKTDNKTEIVVEDQVESGEKNEIKIVVNGRYSNLADFVFDVENDSSLRFKLDNIKMIYSGNNKVEATFDVLSLSVLN